MQVKQFNELSAARRGYTYLTATPTPGPIAALPSSAVQQIQGLNTTIGEIDLQGGAQTAAVSGIKDKASLVRALAAELHSSHMVPIKKVAELVQKGPNGAALSPNFAASISIPHARNFSGLVGATPGILQIVTPYTDLFVARGLPADFLDQLTAATTALSQAITAMGVAKSTRAATTVKLADLFQELRSTMRVLEIAMTKVCTADRVNGPTVKAAWRNAILIRKTAVQADIPFTPPASSAASTVSTGVVSPVASAAASAASAVTNAQSAMGVHA